MEFTFDELKLLSIYSTGVRESTIEELKRMQAYLDADETELYELTVSVLKKLEIISDKEFDLIDPIPYFDE